MDIQITYVAHASITLIALMLIRSFAQATNRQIN